MPSSMHCRILAFSTSTCRRRRTGSGTSFKTRRCRALPSRRKQKMRAFALHRPNTLDELSALLGGGADSVPLAGGMTLLPTIKQRLAAPAALIDLSKIPQMSGISVKDDVLTIGAMTRHVEVAESELVRSNIPLLASLAAGIGGP